VQYYTNLFQETINSQHYITLILEEFINHLHDDDLMIGYFQQDGATAHTSNETMGYLFQFFMTG
jgi:hypothetical protein